jgi:hypothetical protein
MWIGNCLRDSTERSAKEARTAYLASASTCVINGIVRRELWMGCGNLGSLLVDAGNGFVDRFIDTLTATERHRAEAEARNEKACIT